MHACGGGVAELALAHSALHFPIVVLASLNSVSEADPE